MDEGLYGLRFIPKENGVHYLDIKLNDHHIPDSPFAIMVGSMAADPAMVLAHGDGLERGSCGIKPTKIPKKNFRGKVEQARGSRGRGTWPFH